MLTYQDAYDILSKYSQTHILKYYNSLSDAERKSLLSQIELLDFSLLKNVEDKAEENKRGKFEPLDAVGISEIRQRKDEFMTAGINAIKNEKVGAVLLAGGQGTRLGYDKPKGMFNIGVNKELYIFQCLINNILSVVKKAGAWIPLYIMTSEKNDEDTRNFMREMKNFGYNSDYITYFIQDMAPSVGFDGKILMESKNRIAMSPNGNGGWFSSIVRAGLLNEIKKNQIEWLNVFAVDNVLQQIADPLFVGAVLCSGSQSGGKVVKKASPDERVGVLCLENGKPAIVEYYEMTDEMRNRLNADGQLAYNYGVILNYLFNVEKLEAIVNDKLPVHVVKKIIPYINENGEQISPSEPNGYKFETLVLDMVSMQDSCLSYEVARENEFAPVKNSEGVDSVETARELLKKNGIEI
ncbi:MAG: UDPGP type 1 family protein [Ruminococcus sp.]|jgi:UDP-N-acetylglucosamine/UDP-N-acetylgalactosamine diphosphorylase|nr:UDPGP type 1 family protein [Ruminococcus sp.]